MPELCSGTALAQFYDKRRRDELEAVPYFDGLMAGEPDALVGSFAAEPELHDPVRGRVKGTRAFRAFVTEMNAWIARRNITVENVAHVVPLWTLVERPLVDPLLRGRPVGMAAFGGNQQSRFRGCLGDNAAASGPVTAG